MSEEDGESTPPTTAEAFELLGDETRAEILRVLSDARDGGLPPALSFSELRERVAPDARSSQFNYHLQRLRGTYVERRSDGSAQLVDGFVADDEGYALRPDGTFLTRLITAATGDGTPGRVDPFRTDLDCHYCGTAVRARYENRTVELRCPDCGQLYVHTLVPPGVVAGDPAPSELLERAAAYLRRRFETFSRGVCPLCANAAPATVVDPGALDWPRADRMVALLRRTCDHCGNTGYAFLGAELLTDPGLVAFGHRHDLGVAQRPLWELPFAVTDRHTEVVGEEPWEATLTVPAGGAELELRARLTDGDLSVVDRTER